MKKYEKPGSVVIPLEMAENIAASGGGSDGDVTVIIFRNGELVLEQSRDGCDDQELVDWIRKLLGL